MQILANQNASENPADPGPALPPPENGFRSRVPGYALLFYDHLYSEYLTLRAHIEEQPLHDLLSEIHAKRLSRQLTWSDIYTFDLALVEERPLENLIRKAYDARAKYRSIAGQKEFDEYLASKPPDLTSILIAPNAREEHADGEAAGHVAREHEGSHVGLHEGSPSSEIVQRVLRADIRYLMSKFYLYYAMLPVRENLRERLTSRAVRLTLAVLGIIVVLILISVGGILIFRGNFLNGAFGLTVGSVAFAGIIGGCVSMLQRIQSAPSEGDALYNLASLTNGWRGLSLSPLYGGIFASLLFILFAAGILEGSVFPQIKTPGKIIAGATAANPAPEASLNEAAQDPAASPTAPPTVLNSLPATPNSTTQSATQTQMTGILQIEDFLKGTGPIDGVAFALLIVWSFIAGFAERLVPDTLNRLVAKNEAIQGTNT